MMAITILPMKDEDIPFVSAIEDECFSYEKWSETLLRDELKDENKFYYVAKEDDDVVGFCGYIRVLDEGHVMNVAVTPEKRDRGIGRALLEKMLNSGEKKGISAFTLEVRESNLTARRLYERFGFQCVGIRKNYYGTESACIYWLYK